MRRYLQIIKVFIKEKTRSIAVFLVVFATFLTLISCEANLEGIPPQYVLSGASVSKWNADAADEDDYSTSTVSISSLENGTQLYRIKSLFLELDTSECEGLQFIQCQFLLASDTDVNVDIESYCSVDGQEPEYCGASQVSLLADEEQSISVSLIIGVPVERSQSIRYELVFTSSFSAGEEELTFSEKTAVEYKIRDMLFYALPTEA